MGLPAPTCLVPVNASLLFPRFSPSFVEPLGGLWQHQAGIEGKEPCRYRRGWLCCISHLVWPPLCLGSAAQGRAAKSDVFQLKKCSCSQCGFTCWGSSAYSFSLYHQTTLKPGTVRGCLLAFLWKSQIKAASTLLWVVVTCA